MKIFVTTVEKTQSLQAYLKCFQAPNLKIIYEKPLGCRITTAYFL